MDNTEKESINCVWRTGTHRDWRIILIRLMH